MAQGIDPFSSLLDTIDRRSQLFGPDRTATHGFYGMSTSLGVPSVVLDDGRELPNPVTVSGVELESRVVVVWMQGGHDACLLPL